MLAGNSAPGRTCAPAAEPRPAPAAAAAANNAEPALASMVRLFPLAKRAIMSWSMVALFERIFARINTCFFARQRRNQRCTIATERISAGVSEASKVCCTSTAISNRKQNVQTKQS